MLQGEIAVVDSGPKLLDVTSCSMRPRPPYITSRDYDLALPVASTESIHTSLFSGRGSLVYPVVRKLRPPYCLLGKPSMRVAITTTFLVYGSSHE